MTARKPEDIRRAIDGELSAVGRDPFLYQRILNTAREEAPPRRRPRKLTAALIVLAVLALSTAAAVAGNWMGVQYFLTRRLMLPVPVEESYVAHPVSQTLNSDAISLRAQDAYWFADPYGDRLSITVHADVKDAAKAFCMETDIGTDGESFDMIWWHGKIIPVEQWLAGREGYELGASVRPAINGEEYLPSVDCVQEEQGITMLVELRGVPDLSDGATLTLEIGYRTITPSPESYGGYSIDYANRESALLTVILPPMTRGPARDIDGDNGPNT